MNVLFVTLKDFTSLESRNLYTGFLKCFVDDGHEVFIISPIEKRNKTSDNTVYGNGYTIYKPHVGNITDTPFIKKGISILNISSSIKKCIDVNIGKTKIDLMIITVPPVTYGSVVKFVKKRFKCKVYLFLKDIWPASFLDLKISGGDFFKKLVFCFFRIYEKMLYKNSDYIGCLSQANVDYICKHNKYLNPSKVHINPNVISPVDYEEVDKVALISIREKYGLPIDRKCFIYGGTMGIGQNVPHVIKCLDICKNLPCCFVLVGKGVQFDLVKKYVEKEKPQNVKLLSFMPKEEYDLLMRSCDAGIVFLRYSAQTANIPSRILSYMEYGLPILSCTDPVTDLNDIILEGKFGYGCLSDDPLKFKKMIIDALKEDDFSKLGKNGREYLESHYTSDISYRIIKNRIIK